MVAIAATGIFVAVFTIDALLLSSLVSPAVGLLIQAALTLVGVGILCRLLLGRIERSQRQLRRQNEEITALHTAGLAINHDLDLNVVLQRVTDESRRLTAARYSAIMTEDPATGGLLFVTSGLTEEERRRIGAAPQGKGVLGLAYSERRAILVEDIRSHPASAGVPEGHPEMRSLLSVPLQADDEVVGQLYLVDKEDELIFDDDDRKTVERFATIAALAIKNARLLEQTEALAIAAERNRVAREMHDHIAQVLAYVSTKSEAAGELMKAGKREDAFDYITEISRTASDAFGDVREQIVGLRSNDARAQLNDAIVEYADRWSQRTGIAASIDFPVATYGISQEDRLQVLRIVQEALTNAGKHAGCSRVDISAEAGPGLLVINVDDDGSGFEDPDRTPAGEPRFGLAIMRERARLIGGDVELGPSPSGGVRVRLTVPVDDAVERRAAAS